MDIQDSVRELADKHLSPYKIRNGQIIARICPFCGGGDSQDKDTFAVGLYNGAFNCMRSHCNRSGSFRELCEFFGAKAPETIGAPKSFGKRKMYVRPDPEMLKPCTEEIYTYLASRSISKETADAFKLAADDKGNIIFPFYRDGKLIFIKRRVPKKYDPSSKLPKEWQEPNTEPILFNMDGVSTKKPLFITEGELDAMALYEAGVSNVVSVPAGCNRLDWVDLCWDFLEKFQQIVLFGDNDEPGIQMVSTLINRLGEDRVMLPPEYPFIEERNRGCKDANEILVFCGKETLKEIAEQCEPAPVNGILNLADVPFIDPASLPRISTGIPALDNAIGGLGEGGLTIFTGKRGDGKSTLNGQILLNAIDQGYKVCAYSGELSAYKFLEWIFLQATESKYIGVSFNEKLGKAYPCVSYDIQTRIKAWINNNFYLFDNNYINEKKTTQKAILDVFKICARRYGCKVFLVDNLLVALNTTAQEENRSQADFVTALKSFAVHNKVHVILVAHPRKTKPGENIGNDDVAGSSAMTNLADNVISIEKPHIRVIKNRDFGVTPYIECGYCPTNRRIYQLNLGDKKVYGWEHEGIKEPEDKAEKYDSFLTENDLQNSKLYGYSKAS